MSKVIACVGIPGSGKSTFAIKWVLERPGRVRVNRDDIRLGMYGTAYGVNVNERMVSSVQDSIITEALKSGNDVIVDNTNLGRRYLLNLAEKARVFGAGFETIFFDIELHEALQRNSDRTRQVPIDVIKKMHSRYQDLKNEYQAEFAS